MSSCSKKKSKQQYLVDYWCAFTTFIASTRINQWILNNFSKRQMYMILRLYFLDYGKDLDVSTQSEIPEQDIEEEIGSLQKENPRRPPKESHPGLERLLNTRETSTFTEIHFDDVDADMWEFSTQEPTGINFGPTPSTSKEQEDCDAKADETAEKDEQEDQQEEEEEQQEKEVPKQRKRKRH